MIEPLLHTCTYIHVNAHDGEIVQAGSGGAPADLASYQQL